MYCASIIIQLLCRDIDIVFALPPELMPFLWKFNSIPMKLGERVRFSTLPLSQWSRQKCARPFKYVYHIYFHSFYVYITNFYLDTNLAHITLKLWCRTYRIDKLLLLPLTLAHCVVFGRFRRFQWKFHCELCGSFLWYVTFIWQSSAYFCVWFHTLIRLTYPHPAHFSP